MCGFDGRTEITLMASLRRLWGHSPIRTQGDQRTDLHMQNQMPHLRYLQCCLSDTKPLHVVSVSRQKYSFQLESKTQLEERLTLEE